MDFMSEEIFVGYHIQLMALVDNFTRETLAIEVGQGPRGQRLLDVHDRVAAERTCTPASGSTIDPGGVLSPEG